MSVDEKACVDKAQPGRRRPAPSALLGYAWDLGEKGRGFTWRRERKTTGRACRAVLTGRNIW